MLFRIAPWALRALPLIATIVAVSSITDSVRGQEIEQWNPGDRYRYLPRLPQGNENPPPLPRTETEVTGPRKVLVDELRGVVVLDHPDRVVDGKLDVTGIQIQADASLELARTAGFRRIVNRYIGGEVSIFRLNQMVRDIIVYYRDNDEPVVDVSVPQQDITDGVVQIIITEARVGKVIVRGPCYFDPQNLLNQVCISPGDAIYESVLLEDQRWLIRNPFRDVELELTPGKNRGQTDVIFNVRDRKPVRIYAGYEDTGNRTTGLERTIYGFNWYNALNKDDQFGYQYTASSDFSTVGVHSGIYSWATLNRDIWTIYGTYGQVDVPPFFGPANEGVFWQTSIRWNRELCPRGCYEHGIQAGFDFKNTNTSLDFGGVFVGANDADIIQFMIGYNGRKYDNLGSTHFALDIYGSPGGLSGKNNDTAFQGVTPHAKASYAYGRGFFERRFWMPRCTELVTRVTGQLTHTNLLPPETLGLGGYNSVRGYDQYTYAADSGFFVNLEWWSPSYYCLFGDDELRFFTFFDIGEGYQHSQISGLPNSVGMAAVGLGARYQLGRSMSLRADYGYQLRDAPTVLPQPDSRFHIGLIFSY